MSAAAYEKWAARQRANEQHRWDRWPPTAEQRAEFEHSIRQGGGKWQDALDDIEERARLLPGKFLASVPSRAGECAMAAESVGVIAEVDAWRKKTEKTGGILGLSGPVGTGKTVAACRVSWAQMLDGYGPYKFIRAADLATMSRYGDEREAFLKHDRVIVDDLGAEYLDKAGSFLTDLDHLVDIAYSNRRHLVITTNTTKDTFAKRYGERIVDRIRECGTWITVAGTSRRKAP